MNNDREIVLNSSLDNKNSLFNANLVVFDNASGINICRNQKFAKDIQKGPAKYLAGINSTKKSEKNTQTTSIQHRQLLYVVWSWGCVNSITI